MNQRTNQLERTRTAIIDAASEMVLGASDPEEFTMQAVADAAGVSHRTLYRHFASRQDLVNAVGRRIDAGLGKGAADQPQSFDAWVDGVERMVLFGATNRDVLRRGLLLGVAHAEFRSDRDETYWRLFRERFPHLDDTEARQDYVVVRHLLGANSVILIGERFGLTPEELIPTIKRSVETLISDIERRDAIAAGETA